MLPLKLKIKGLYSYKTEQTIDFENLTKSHLFGIFGAVGSGKSSILDAITFALYGQVERVGKNDALNQNIFNQAAQDFLIDFEFESGENQNKYRFVVKNGRRKNGDPKSFDRFAYTWKSDDWLPLNISDASSIFNLSYDNFKRTVIIPQGKFSDFLQLTGGERTKMMLELFPKLNEFDFNQKVSVFIGDNKEKLNTLEGQLLEIGLIEVTDIEAKNIEISDSENFLKSEKDELVKLEKQFLELNELKKLFDEAFKKKEVLKTLELQKPQFDLKKEKLDRYELIFRKFDSDIKLLDGAKKALSEAELKVSKTTFDWNETNQNLEVETKKLEIIQAKNALLPKLENEISDLKLLLERLNLESNFHIKKAESEKIKLGLEQLIQNKLLIQNELKTEKDHLEKLESEQSDSNQIILALQFFKEETRILAEKKTKNEALTEIQMRIDSLKISKDQTLKSEIFNNLPHINTETKIKDIILALEAEKGKIEIQISEIQNHIFELAKKEQLFQFSNQMVNDEPCPLCGSMHHPNIVSAEDVSALQQHAQKQIVSSNYQVKQLELSIKLFQEISTKLFGEVEKRNSSINDLKINAEVFEKHNLEFAENPFKEHGQVKVQELYKNLEARQKEASNLKKKIKEQEQILSETDKRIEPENSKLNAINEQVASLDGQILNLKNQIQNQNEITEFSLTEIENRIKQLNSQIEKTKKEFELQTTIFQGFDKKFTALTATLEIQKENLEKCRLEESQYVNGVTIKIENENSGSLAEIRQILSENLDTEKLKVALNSFFENLNFILNELKNLEIKIDNQVFEEVKWIETTENLKEIKKQISEREGTLAVLKEQEQLLKGKVQKLEKLNLEKLKLEARRDNLNVLAALFRGNAFVNYVSSVYLKNVVEVANQRFFKLTRQKLRLVLDGENNFYVKDFLNNGHERLAKTMSGGQIFQASLSLALALADTVRNLTKSNRNFFFLDEGFGSLDKESLHLVFDTLRQLRHENRIVGVISHIEEMQQEIDNCLKIRMDEEKGSIIEVVQ